jgi:hypothetical protein
MSRVYRVTFEAVSISAAQDLLQIKGASGKMLRILRRWVGATDTTIPSAQMLSLRERFLPATVSDGSGGSTPAPQKTDPGDAAASFTALSNSTSKATTNGTAVTLYEDSCHIYNGFNMAVDEPYPIGPSESYVFELLSTVSGTVHLSGGVIVEEIGG